MFFFFNIRLSLRILACPAGRVFIFLYSLLLLRPEGPGGGGGGVSIHSRRWRVSASSEPRLSPPPPCQRSGPPVLVLRGSTGPGFTACLGSAGPGEVANVSYQHEPV